MILINNDKSWTLQYECDRVIPDLRITLNGYDNLGVLFKMLLINDTLLNNQDI